MKSLHNRLARFVFVSLFATPIAAQRTYVVDAANGPGTDFTVLQAACDAANHGDTLLVKPGIYVETVVRKGIAIVGQPGVRIYGFNAPGLTITSIPAARTCTVTRVESLRFTYGGPIALVTDCAGAVHLEGLQTQPVITPAITDSGLAIRRSVQVTVHGAMIECGVAAEKSTFAITDSILIGRSTAATDIRVPSTPGLTAKDSDLEIAGTSIRGGDWGWTLWGIELASPAVFLEGSNASIAGASVSLRAGAEQNTVPGMTAMWVDRGVAYVAPTVIVVPSGSALPYWTSATGRVVSVEQPSLSATSTAPGGSIVTDVFGRASSIGALVLGVPGPRQPVQNGALWIDPTSLSYAGIFALASSRHRIAAIPVPADGKLHGVAVAMQAIELYASTLSISAPATIVLY
ncbi:MAG: hypothetical protein KDC95_03705 [Planctomycetes bacterium]|nr:hypothetical protein [Planctomycetota bacterium]